MQIADVTPPKKPKSDRPAPALVVLEDNVVKQGHIVYAPSS